MPDEASSLFLAPSRLDPQTTPEEAVFVDVADSVNIEPRIPIAFDTLHCTELDAPSDRLNNYTTGRPGYTAGMTAHPRPTQLGHDTGVMALLMAMFLLMALNCRHYAIFFKTFAQDLLKVRERDNVFDDRTVSETRIVMSLVATLCVCEGILLHAALPWARFTEGVSLFGSIATLSVVAGVYYGFQLAANAVVGYLFTSPGLATQLLRGYNASQALLGLCLVIPTLAVLFRPAYGGVMLVIAATLYIAARIVFICKGFKIFYHNYFSLIYFILYLCSLEIVPLLLVYRAARIISA